MKPVVWFADSSLRAAAEKLVTSEITGTPGVEVTSSASFAAAIAQPGTVAFVDPASFPEVAALERIPAALIAVCSDTLPTAVEWLQRYPWLSHVTSAAMLEHPLAAPHLQNVLATFERRKPKLLDWIAGDVKGRRVKLALASRRVERLERMTEFLSDQGVGTRTIEQVRDAAEELLTNAFYDAPAAAGLFDQPVSREIDVSLPEECACDLSYGVQGSLAIVRVRDPFGSLSRQRLVEVLTRCARNDVTVDESMGGAGLGMWKIFSTATFVAISVLKQQHTEILVGYAKRAPGTRPFSFHLYFADGVKPRRWAFPLDASTASERSIVLVESK